LAGGKRSITGLGPRADDAASIPRERLSLQLGVSVKISGRKCWWVGQSLVSFFRALVAKECRPESDSTGKGTRFTAICTASIEPCSLRPGITFLPLSFPRLSSTLSLFLNNLMFRSSRYQPTHQAPSTALIHLLAHC
jgi:hypothetical protein